MAYCIAGNYTIQNCLGIGTDPASHALDVVGVGTTANVGAIIANFKNSGAASRLIIVDEDGAAGAEKPGGILSTTGYGIGIYSTSTNTAIKFYAGGCAAANEVMRICSNGRVGIGTTTPGFKLQVDGSGADTIGFFGASGMTAGQSVYFQVGKNCTSLNNAGEISFRYCADDSSCNMVSLGFYGNGQKLNIVKSGNVGIGTTSPGAALDVTGTIRTTPGAAGFCADHTYLGITYRLGTGEVSDNIDFRICGGSAGGFTTGGNFRWHTQVGNTAPTERMRITPSGNVGIGTCSPGSLLTVTNCNTTAYCTQNTLVNGQWLRLSNPNGTAGVGTGLLFEAAGAVGGNGLGTISGVSTAVGSLSITFGTRDAGSNVIERMRLTSDGNVGINTPSPSSRLHVVGSGSQNSRCTIAEFRNICDQQRIDIRDENGTTCQPPGLYSPAAGFGLGLYASAGPLILYAGGITTSEERIRITTTGNVGIGICIPTYRLHVNGSFYAAGSSIKYKEGICDYNTNSCLFMCLKPVAYQYKDEFKHLGKELKADTQIGLIAEDVAQVMPELAILVNEEDEKVVRNVDYEKLSVVLLKEVQKLRQEVDQLKNR